MKFVKPLGAVMKENPTEENAEHFQRAVALCTFAHATKLERHGGGLKMD
jgi:hypothetical protein